MRWNAWLVLGAVNAFVAVAAGAFGAHGLKGRLSPEMLANFETGARYHMYHALALLAVGWVAARSQGGAIGAAGWCFTIGIVVFCGSLYGLSLSGVTRLGAITPIGGTAMLVGWLLLAWAAWKAQ